MLSITKCPLERVYKLNVLFSRQKDAQKVIRYECHCASTCKWTVCCLLGTVTSLYRQVCQVGGT